MTQNEFDPHDYESIYADEPARPDLAACQAEPPAALARPETPTVSAAPGRPPASIGTVVLGLVVALLAIGSLLRVRFDREWDTPMALAGLLVGVGVLLMGWTGAMLAIRRRPHA